MMAPGNYVLECAEPVGVWTVLTSREVLEEGTPATISGSWSQPCTGKMEVELLSREGLRLKMVPLPALHAPAEDGWPYCVLVRFT